MFMSPYIWTLLVAILLYRYLPVYETNHNQLILLQMDPNHVKTLKELKIVQALFKIEANIDSHMERDNNVEKILNNKEVCMCTTHWLNSPASLTNLLWLNV